MSTPPELTPAALAYLDGRDVHVRSSRRHGCCGGSAAIPTAEAGTPTDVEGLQHFDVADTSVYVDTHLNPGDKPWTIDVDGFARWRRLVVVGLDLATLADTPPTSSSHHRAPAPPLNRVDRSLHDHAGPPAAPLPPGAPCARTEHR
ncbi:MAG: CC/Se motif family (seleno)protein [Acidimicrobiales bacterium]